MPSPASSTTHNERHRIQDPGSRRKAAMDCCVVMLPACRNKGSRVIWGGRGCSVCGTSRELRNASAGGRAPSLLYASGGLHGASAPPGQGTRAGRVVGCKLAPQQAAGREVGWLRGVLLFRLFSWTSKKRGKARKNRIHSFVPKPCSIECLMATVDQVLNREKKESPLEPKTPEGMKQKQTMQ